MASFRKFRMQIVVNSGSTRWPSDRNHDAPELAAASKINDETTNVCFAALSQHHPTGECPLCRQKGSVANLIELDCSGVRSIRFYRVFG